MKNLLLIASLGLLGIFTAGCERIEGQLVITKSFKLKNTKGDSHLLPPGIYSADIKSNTSKKITLRLNNDSDEKFLFTHSGNIPKNGPFKISSSTSGQPVDLFGNINTTEINLGVKEMYESCTYQEPYTVCYPMPNGGANCSVQYRTVYGTQWIRYYDRKTVKNVDLSVTPVKIIEEVANFHGDITYIDRIILSQSICR